MAHFVYVLCAVTCLLCAWALMRNFFLSKTPLLFWSGLCFVGLSLNNILLEIDLMLGADFDLSVYRGALAVASMAVMLYGLIWDTV